MAITWAGGVAPIIVDNGTYAWADIEAADTTGGWGQFTSGGTNVPSYRSRVSVQICNSANTTHLEDATGSVVVFDNTRTLTFGGTATARFVTLGTRIGSGNTASGVRGGMVCFGATTVLSGTVKLYGCTIRQTTGAITWTAPSDGIGEAINCLFQSTAGATAPFNFGSASIRLGNFYNCDFSHTTSNQVMSNFNVVTSERITIGGAGPTALLSSGAASVVIKDLALFGTPTQSDLRWATNGAILWSVIRPRWSGNADKFSIASPGSPNLSGATVEYWRWGVKVVGSDGSGISGIPVKLTDNVGNVQVDTTTDANGEIDFGSGLTENAVAVADWYAVGTTVTLRHRSPFLVEVNTGGSANPGYPSRRYYHNWTGYSAVTNTAGSFGDMNDVIALEGAAGNPTNWVELEL